MSIFKKASEFTLTCLISIVFTIVVMVPLQLILEKYPLLQFWGDRTGYVLELFLLLPIGNSLGLYALNRLVWKKTIRLRSIVVGYLVSLVTALLCANLAPKFRDLEIIVIPLSLTFACMLGAFVDQKIRLNKRQ